MKRTIIILAMLFSTVLASFSQNFMAPENKMVKVDTTTTYTYQIKEKKYPVYKGRSGAFYIWKTSSKTGKKYKYYLPKEIQIKMGRKR